MTDEGRRVDEVDGAVAKDLVSDMQAINRFGVANLWSHLASF